jgi:predicted flap endonuclease-1-like 5' DNA nuclease
MIHYLIELAFWMLLAYFLGCLIGWFARNLFGQAPAVAPIVAAAPVVAAAVARPAPMVARPIAPPAPVPAPMVARPVAPPAPAPVVHKPAVVAPVVTAPKMETGKMDRPKGLDKARGGKPDDLQRISGIGPKNESILHTLGFFHFDQIAAWTSTQVAWVDDHLRFNGRIKREEWIRQAGLLATGKEDEFKRDYGTGGLKNKQGATLSGSRTRK